MANAVQKGYDISSDQWVVTVLTFDSLPIKLTSNTFLALEPGAAAAIYHNQLAFVYPQIDERDVILANTWRSVDVGQKTSLKKQENDVHVFTDPVSTGVERAVVVENVTDDNKNIALGFTSDPSLPPTSILYFDGIGPNSNIATYFSPIVSAHVAAEYQQGQVIRGEIATPEIWSADLSALKESTVLIFSRNKATGQYSLKPALAL
ncbi:hypothetical protein FS842_010342 [Serendipita sp. 407]|nr:hypothetical protein FS842_010342 [Serendipita sp. 407]